MIYEIINESHSNSSKGQSDQKLSQTQDQKTKSDKEYDIRERTLNFAVRIMEIARNLPSHIIYSSIRSQLVRSGTAIGANLAEGDGAKTRRDFVNKLVIARKEAKETKYWLRLINGQKIENLQLDDDIQEIQEIINVLSAIIKKIENKNKN
jgi:four helix bundle protein